MREVRIAAEPGAQSLSPVTEWGNGWELYLVNGPQQHKNQLRHGASPGGCGDLASNPSSGAHKMSETVFDARGFTELLAVGQESWVHVQRAKGGKIPASDAFKVGAAHGYRLKFSNGLQKDSPGNDPWRAQSNHGPFFVDVNINPGQEGGQWMWCDAEFGGPGRLRMGKILGTKGACFADENGGFVWKWYGRRGSIGSSSRAAAATQDTPWDAFVGKTMESYPNGKPHEVVETFRFEKAGTSSWATIGSKSGRNEYTLRDHYLVHKAHANVTARLENGEFVWSHGFRSRLPNTVPQGRLAAELAQAAWDGNLSKVRSLLDSGAPANTEEYNGFSNGHHSALNGASRNGHAEIVKLLLEQPVKPDIESRCQGPWEVTPLQQAGYWGRASCARILLGHGASITSKSGPGCNHKTAKQIAEEQKKNQWRELVELINASSSAAAPTVAAACTSIVSLEESFQLAAIQAAATVSRSVSEPYWEVNLSGRPFKGQWTPVSEEQSIAFEAAFQAFLAGGDLKVDIPGNGKINFGVFSSATAGARSDCPLRRVESGKVTHPPPDFPHPWYIEKVSKVEQLGGPDDWLTNAFFFRAFQMAVQRDGGDLGFLAPDLFSFQFCSDFRSSQPNLERRGGVLYEVPAGWKRFALNVKGRYADGNDWMCMDGRPGEWAVAYHGTKFDAVPKIIKNGFRLGIRHGPAAMKLKDTRSGQAVQEGICCTPNLEVVECFANGEEADTGCPPVTLDGHTLFFALQCRVRPGAIRRPNNTTYTKTNNDEEQMGVRGVFEWVIENPVDIRPYAVLVRDRASCTTKKSLHALAVSFASKKPTPGAFYHVPGHIDSELQAEAERKQMEKMDRTAMPRLSGAEARKG
eukprot:TRINITY_DN27113_c0_g1_i2.p1 TRINITY_DN27113_c0_g1~~TRINITY_DN27113_c0_g1_i2.p1  ORF type:complete len:863 (-),score=132.18 TRINITY_DN27113_c0_g1_i2:107-2695(-)